MKRKDIARKSDNWKDLYKRQSPEDMEDEELPHGPILYYNEIVIEHCTNPKNVGEIADADGYALVGDPSCGDAMELWIKVDSGKISDIKFKSTGCAGALATSSMTTVLAKGQTIEAAKGITDDHVVAALKGVSRKGEACTLSGITALREAIGDYERKNHGDEQQ